jgi:small subunit ribosomal protein S17
MPTKKTENKVSLRKKLTGVVTKFSGANTVKVDVERKYPHSKYGKIVKTNKSYLVHVEGEIAEGLNKGDVVLIEETRPISKRKCWKLNSILKKQEQI